MRHEVAPWRVIIGVIHEGDDPPAMAGHLPAARHCKQRARKATLSPFTWLLVLHMARWQCLDARVSAGENTDRISPPCHKRVILTHPCACAGRHDTLFLRAGHPLAALTLAAAMAPCAGF
nr:hypothetical protein BOH68_06515 [Cobetia sp. MM1IDA2H-1]